MKKLLALLIVLVAGSASLARGQSSSSTRPAKSNASESEPLKPYHLIKTIPLPFLKKMSGQLGFDEENDRLFFSDGKNLVVVNPDSGEKVGIVPKVGRISDIAFAPDIHRAFIVDSDSGELFALNLSTLTVIDKVNVGTESSSVQYDPEVKEVFTTGSESSTCKVFDAVAGKKVATVKLRGYPVHAAHDAHGRIYFELTSNAWRRPPLYAPLTYVAPLKTDLAELDTRTMEMGDRWSEPSCPHLQLVGIDRSGQDLVIGCPNSVTLVDPRTRKIVADSAITSAVLAFNAQLGDAFVAGADQHDGRAAFLIVHEDSSGHLGPAMPAPQVLARPAAFDGTTQRFFAVQAETKTIDTGLFMETPGGETIPLNLPQPIPGTFRILIYGRD